MARCSRTASRCSSSARCSLSASWSRVAASTTRVWYSAVMSWNAPRTDSAVPAGPSTGSANTRICRTLPSSARTIRNVVLAGRPVRSSVSRNSRNAGTSAPVT